MINEDEILYDAATTRIVRRAGLVGGACVVCKEYLGPNAAARLRGETDALALLEGVEGVVQLAQAPVPAGTLALEDCGGIALAQFLDAGRMDSADMLPLAAQLARVLAAVHRAGLIHRDVNPANILLTPQRRAVLIDFDLAVQAGQRPCATQDGAIAGTLGYMAPEQTGRTGRVVDQRADLYALGVTLYQIATGRLPFEAQDPLQLIHEHMTREPAAPVQLDASLPQGLSDLILRLLAKEPDERYQSAVGLLHDLVQLGQIGEAGGRRGFTLGALDFGARLAPLAHLVGRDAELAALRKAFDDSLTSASQTVLVEGSAGVGKSALINGLRPWVAAAGGWMVYGKVDQYQRDAAATGAISQAMRALGRLLLAQPGDELSSQRQRIMAALGPNTGLATALWPEFALLLGDQPDVPELDPMHAELRLQQAGADLLGSIASPQRPLVVVLDDLHWASELPLRAFEHLMNQAQMRGVLLIGAYRAGELDGALPLAFMLARWTGQPQSPVRIVLDNLTPASMEKMIAQMLRLDPGPAQELAKAVGSLSCGNPFDTVELVNALRAQGVLKLGEQGWQWEVAAIRHFVGNGNVGDLLAGRVANLPAPSRELLECMSCLGGAVEREVLCAATGLSDAELLERQLAPLEDGLVVAGQGGHESLQFRHDRVQQAVLATLGEHRRTRLQLDMARRMACRPALAAMAAQQYLGGMDALEEPQEQGRVARLLHQVASQLAGVANYGLAQRYLDAAGALLDGAREPAGSPLRAAVNVGLHAALYSQGRLDEADPYYMLVADHTTDVLELIEPACLQLRSLTYRGRMRDAERLGMDLLPCLGLNVPARTSGSDAAGRLDALCRWVYEDREQDPSGRGEVSDRRVLTTAKLLTCLLLPALISDPHVMAWLVLESQRLWSEHGACPELMTCLGRAGIVLVNMRQDYRAAYDVVRHVLDVGQARNYRPHTSETRHSFAITVCHWFEPLEDALRHEWRAREELLEVGDQSYACYTYRGSVPAVLDCAASLDAFDDEIQASLALSRRTGNVYNSLCALTDLQLLRCLRGQTSAAGSFADSDFDPAAHLDRLSKLPIALVAWHLRLALASAIFGDTRELLMHTRAAMPLLGAIPGYYLSAHAHALRALALAAQVRRGKDAGTAAALAELENSRAWLAARAQDQALNFAHLSCLIQAEQAWALGDRWAAALAFDAALAHASKCQRPWHLALIMECAARFYLEHGMNHFAQPLMAQSQCRYGTWGATAKVKAMQREHPWLVAAVAASPRPEVGAGSNAISPDVLDLMGVVRASQALSSETSLARLTARVEDVLAALTGATRVSVLSWSDGQWWLLSSAASGRAVRASGPDAHAHLPTSAFAYADRTQEPLLVDDALNDDRFSRDPYFAGLAHCSLLLVPIAIQGAPRAMLLLENRLGRAAFNAERLDAVMLIAGQLAVSLANVQLLESLEQRVRERTRELQDTQAQLVSTARRAGMAEIANNVLHNVGNVLNSVNISAGVVSNRISGSKTQGLARAVGLMNDNAGRLGEFMSNDERGKLLPGYLNQLVDALDEERSAVIGELARLVRSVNHIKAVVATQQSHAGASNVLEMEHASQLVDEALRMNAASMERHRVTPVRQFETVPQLPLDRLKVLQIMVNLIHNAAQAMDALPEHARRMTLSIEVVRDGSGEHLRIKVRDEGEGISKENLARIFSHGFTTRKDGHGFGLHSSALAAIEMGGTLTAHSDGPGQGAIFMLELPITARSKGNEREPANPDR